MANTEKRNLNNCLRVVNTLSESEKIKREDNIIKDIKNIFRLRKETDSRATKDIRSLFKIKKENETIN